MYIITLIIILNYEKKSSYKKSILSDSLMSKPRTTVQVKFLHYKDYQFYYKNDIRDWGQSTLHVGADTYEPVHEISNNLVCATSIASDQPAHTRSLIRAFASRLSIL